MPSALEYANKQDGSHSAERVLAEQVTQEMAQLYAIRLLIKDTAPAASDLIESVRDRLCEIRNYIENHFQFKPKDAKRPTPTP